MSTQSKPLTKLTKESLREIIIEIMNEVNPRHSSKDGKFIKKDEAGIYSLTKNNKLKSDTESELEVPARGEVGASGKISSRYGMNSGDEQCGRLDIDGKPKKKKRRCKSYSKKNNYGTKNEEQQQSNSIESSADLLYIKQLIKQEVEAMTKKTSQTTKSQSRGKPSKEGCSFVDILKGIRAIKTAEEVPAPPRSKKRYV
jgi:hypothetical protein